MLSVLWREANIYIQENSNLPKLQEEMVWMSVPVMMSGMNVTQ